VSDDAPDTSGPAANEDVAAPAGPARPAALVVLGLAALLSVGLDAFTKQLALTHLEGADPVRLLGGAVYFNLTRNSGAAFSIGGKYTVVFPIIATVVVIGILWLARRLRSIPWGVAMGLVLGGALGNLMDRIFRAPGPLRGHVVDFISVFDEAGGVWPIFNVADSSLFCGVALVLVLEFTGRGRDGSRVTRDKVRDSDRAQT
jgi:signal peptidase II